MLEPPEFSEVPSSQDRLLYLMSENERLTRENNDMVSRSIGRNTEYEREIAGLKGNINELIVALTDADQTIQSQYDDLEDISGLAKAKVQEARNRIFFLHQLLTAIASYDGDDPSIPADLARTVLDEVVDESFEWPDEKEN